MAPAVEVPAPTAATRPDAPSAVDAARVAEPSQEPATPPGATQPTGARPNGIAIVLVLPLDSAVYGRAAAAVSAGFLAAAQADATPTR